MKELLVQYSEYNVWANQLMLDAILTLPEEKHRQEIVSSFSSLYKTVLHMWDTEAVWWQRMKLQERISAPGDNFAGDMNELCSQYRQQNRMWYEWVSGAQEHMLRHVFQYQNSKREQFKQPLYQMVLHVFNHGTYHRGQLVTMMRQLGAEKIPQTDFIIWSRKR